MYGKKIVSAVAALGMATGVMAVSCSDKTADVKSTQDALDIGKCEKFKGNIQIGNETDSQLKFTGLEEVGGDITCTNNAGLVSLSAPDLKKVGGIFKLEGLAVLSTLDMGSLNSVKELQLLHLGGLSRLGFGTEGIKSADRVEISDTRLNSIEGVNVQSLAKMDINNNRHLAKFDSSIRNLTDVLNINANGLGGADGGFQVALPNLEWIANMTISNVTEFKVPSLTNVTGNMRFDSNFFKSFSAANLTEVKDGEFSFVSNSNLQNISIPMLERIGGGFTIANNTDLNKVDGFPALKDIGGAVALRGSFTDVELPALKDVRGTFTIKSTEDIENSCKRFEDNSAALAIAPDCKGKVANANDDTSSGDDSGNGDDKSAASPLSMSMSAVISLAAVAGVMLSL